ncbi:DUF6090 family protein [Winogradskyella maritima]|uniref:DUF6090 family protein n=1 Tax=Winogradskyella maritima TaxID=1517766 RepID=A0ABV8AKG9_9FLAO|nr:DUF6090 family protein [Winogradskyella maritima]
MIKFFRHIRYNLMSENKTGKYFKYAIGEIILVVIGILIALQINNWNEQRKINKEKAQLTKSIKAELEADVDMIKTYLSQTNYLDSIFKAERQKLSKMSQNKDSLVHFVRNEMFIYMNEFTGFNNNTYNSAKSTGKLQIIDENLKNELFDLFMQQEEILTTNATYFQVVLDKTNDLMENYPVSLSFSYINEGDLNELMWTDVNKKDLALKLNLWGTSRGNFIRMTNSGFSDLLTKTESILKLMEDYD